MKRYRSYLVLALFVAALVVIGSLRWSSTGHTAAVAGGGIPISTNVANGAGGSAIFLANSNRRFLFCQNIGAVNAIFITWGQTPTVTNGYLLAANGGTLTLPQAGCNSAGQNTPPGDGCVPLSAINAIAAASGTNTLVCTED